MSNYISFTYHASTKRTGIIVIWIKIHNCYIAFTYKIIETLFILYFKYKIYLYIRYIKYMAEISSNCTKNIAVQTCTKTELTGTETFNVESRFLLVCPFKFKLYEKYKNKSDKSSLKTVIISVRRF